MSHVDPLFAIPAGLFFVVMGSWVAVAPEQFPRVDWTVRFLDSVVGRTATNVVLRLGGAVMAVGSGWLALHAALEVLAR